LQDSERVKLRDALAVIAREAGELAVTTAKGTMKRWMKAGSSPVSEADLAVDRFLSTRLPPLVPDAGWLSEETEDNPARLNAKKVWVVDPIDGTRAFLDNRPDWSVSIALVEDGRPIVAALYAPITDEMFLATRSGGATRNGVALEAARGEGLAGMRIAGPKSHLERLQSLERQVRPQPKVFSLALRATRVATGEFDAALASRNSHDWDLAAADLLVHEAGGTITDLDGVVIAYNRPDPVHGTLIAAGKGRHRALIETMRDRRDDFA
jgi:myo-inositol-1(or 4)-monophosphatase